MERKDKKQRPMATNRGKNVEVTETDPLQEKDLESIYAAKPHKGCKAIFILFYSLTTPTQLFSKANNNKDT